MLFFSLVTEKFWLTKFKSRLLAFPYWQNFEFQDCQGFPRTGKDLSSSGPVRTCATLALQVLDQSLPVLEISPGLIRTCECSENWGNPWQSLESLSYPVKDLESLSYPVKDLESLSYPGKDLESLSYPGKDLSPLECHYGFSPRAMLLLLESLLYNLYFTVVILEEAT